MRFCNTKLFCRLAATSAFALVTATAAAQPIKIGWLSSLTGALSSAAIAENEGVKIAVDERSNCSRATQPVIPPRR